MWHLYLRLKSDTSPKDPRAVAADPVEARIDLVLLFYLPHSSSYYIDYILISLIQARNVQYLEPFHVILFEFKQQ